MNRTGIVRGVSVALALLLINSCESVSNKGKGHTSDIQGTYSLVSQTDALLKGNRSRLKLGVGETVTLRVVPEPKEAPHWMVEGPGEVDRVGNPVRFAAAGLASAPVVSTVVNGQRLSIAYRVVEPEFERVSRVMGCPLTNTLGGVWMQVELEVHPTDVSFGHVELREISGAPSRVTGYFEILTARERYHDAETWRGLTEMNSRGQINTVADKAYIDNLKRPWSKGTIEWVIPVEWRVPRSPHTGTLPPQVQTFSMDGPSGTVSVTKFEQSLSRDPSNPATTRPGRRDRKCVDNSP